MKNHLFNSKKLLAGLLLFAGLAASSLFAETTLAIRADNWFPYNGDPTSEKPGYGIEVLRNVLEKNGMKLDYQIMPWKRAISEAAEGNISGVIGAMKSDTPGFVFPDEPIGYSGSCVFVKKGNSWRYTDVGSLKGKCLGVISGYCYGDVPDAYIKEHLQESGVIDVCSGDTADEQGIKKLQAGRIDVYISDPTVFAARVASLGLSMDEFENAGTASQPDPIYVSLSPKLSGASDIAQKITDGIREMRKSGELEKILSKYGVNDWAK